MSSLSIILITIFCCSVWSCLWVILYSQHDDEWMTILAGGPVCWIIFGFISLINCIIKLYYKTFWKAVVIDDDGLKYKCNSLNMDDIMEAHNLKPAFEFAKNTKYKPYKPKSYNFTENPRYVHISVLKNMNKIKE